MNLNRMLKLLAAVVICHSMSAIDAADTDQPKAGNIEQTTDKTQNDKKITPVVNDTAFHAKLKEIAANYESFGRVDDTLRLAPILCGMPQHGTLKPSIARFSSSDDPATHGQKLYYIFAFKPSEYQNLTKENESVAGQMVVKQSWTAMETKADEPTKVVETPAVLSKALKTIGGDLLHDHYVPYAKKDGKLFHADSKAGLFIMYKTDPKTENTDDGWVYGTVSADSNTITSAGRVKSCMNCHQEAPHGRLFGLKNIEE